NTSKLRYVFTGNLAVQAGATLSVAANVPVLIQPGVTITDNGTMTTATGDVVTFGYAYGATTLIVVGTGASFNPTGTTFTPASTGSNTYQVVVNTAGHMTP